MSKNQEARGTKKTLAEVPEDIAVAQVRHFGDQLTIPENMTLSQAIELIQRRQKYMDEETQFAETFDFHPYDGANAIQEALNGLFGWSCAEPTPGLFGDRPPALLKIAVGPKEYRNVPWGRFALPGCEDGWLATSADFDGQRVRFAINGVVKRKFEGTVNKVFDRVRWLLENQSIYRGKAIKMRFKDDDGCDLEMPTPEFMDLTDVDESMLIYSEDVQRQIDHNLFIPISRVHDAIANDIPIKRGVLLAGKYGTGKTLAAKVAAKLAVTTKNTFLYTPHADELNKAIEFAKQYQSPACVIFCEDIDRAVTGERSVEMDDILNIIDGIDTKTANIITVLTSNHLEEINPALLRPGRLDAVIEVTPPDATAVTQLIRAYGGSTIEPSVNLDEVSRLLAGQIPAVIAEVVKRAKLTQLALVPPGSRITGISEEALIEAAKSIKFQTDLLDRRSSDVKPPVPSLERTFIALFRHAFDGQSINIETTDDNKVEGVIS